MQQTARRSVRRNATIVLEHASLLLPGTLFLVVVAVSRRQGETGQGRDKGTLTHAQEAQEQGMPEAAAGSRYG